MDKETLLQVETRLGYHFKNPELLDRSLRHSSQADDRLESNERLEFLGDSVLGLVICRTLFDRFPGYLEGDLTKIKSMIVSRKTCAHIARSLHLHQFVRVGKGTDQTKAVGGSIAAGVLEAVIAAIYIDGGWAETEAVILNWFGPLIEKVNANQHHNNFKSILQQYCQREFNSTPHYELLDEKGPDHNKCFEIGVVIRNTRYPSAWGVTKKDAEQRAAQNTLVELGLLQVAEDPYGEPSAWGADSANS
jgi:ribonuclease-3